MLKEPGQLRGDGGREGREESLQCMHSRPVHSSQLVHHMGLCVWGRKGLLQDWTVCVGEEEIIARLDCVRGGGRDYCKAGVQWCSQVPSWSV